MAKPRTKASKGIKLPAEPLTEVEVIELIRACSRRAPTGIRNSALIALLYRTGLRIGEALALKPKDVDVEKCTARVLHGKGDKARLVGLDEQTCTMLARWLDARSSLGLTARQPIFCTITRGNGSKPGQPLEQAYIRSLLPRLARKAGIDKRVHAHGLRHSHAFELAGEGVPMHVIQQQLGHSNLSVTSRYINHLGSREVVEAMRRRPVECVSRHPSSCCKNRVDHCDSP